MARTHPLEKHRLQFLDSLRLEKRLQESSLKVYESEIEQFMTLCGKADATPYLKSFHKKESTTVRRKLSILRSFLKTCPEPWNNCLDRIKQPKLRKKEPNFLTEDELFRLESAACRSKESSRDRLLVAFGSQLGLRLSEILQLKFEHIQEAWIKILRKGGKEQRLPLTKSLQSLILFYKREKSYTEESFIFETSPGQALSSRGAQKIISKLAKEAKIQKRISPHALRHSFATKLAAKGTSLAVVKEFLGHERITTTERYLHVTPEYLKEALSTLEPFDG